MIQANYDIRVNVTMSNPGIKGHESVDPMLTITMGRVSGETWAERCPRTTGTYPRSTATCRTSMKFI